MGEYPINRNHDSRELREFAVKAISLFPMSRIFVSILYVVWQTEYSAVRVRIRPLIKYAQNLCIVLHERNDVVGYFGLNYYGSKCSLYVQITREVRMNTC